MSGKRFRFGTSMAVLCILALSACSPQFRNHGYVPNDEDLALITVGVDTRASVEEAVGAPAMSGVITDTATYYVQSRVRRFAWQEPEVVERQVLAISYDSAGVVTNIERFGRAHLAPHHRHVRHQRVDHPPSDRQHRRLPRQRLPRITQGTAWLSRP